MKFLLNLNQKLKLVNHLSDFPKIIVVFADIRNFFEFFIVSFRERIIYIFEIS